MSYRPVYATSDAEVEILLGVLERAGVPRWSVDVRDMDMSTDDIGRKYDVDPDLLARALARVLI
jgi:hypothetical protein